MSPASATRLAARARWWLCVLLVGCAGRQHGPDSSVATWCNHALPAGERQLRLPASLETMAGAASGGVPEGEWHWLVVWATWCEPCLRELPRVMAAARAMRREGTAVHLTLLSIDADPSRWSAALRRFSGDDRSGGRQARFRSADEIDAWVASYGLDAAGAGLPFHLLAAPTGALACVHTGEVTDEDVARVARLIRTWSK